MRIIRNYDVGSYYPHLCTVNGYTSRNIPSPQIYSDVLDQRMQAKAAGDKATANALKLVCNTTYGCMRNKYNNLYDPLMARSVCISGQLYLLELAEHLYHTIPDLVVCQLNTDGIMVEFDDQYYDDVLAITNEWQRRTGFDLEEDKIVQLAQKDVNGYLEVQADGKVKRKGGFLVRGISTAGAFKVNNNAVVVAEAISEYLLHGTPVEDTITACNDITKFQLIAKAGTTYKEAYHIVDGEKQPVQRVNRVYATTDERYGKLFKVKAGEKDDDDTTAKIDSLPEHCIIDNDNHLTIASVDKTFYIKMAQDRVNAFLGIKPEKKRRKKMATAKVEPMNVYQKLAKARALFMEGGVSKSGKNPTLKFKYFELDDIVPTATRIFGDIGLISVVEIRETEAAMKIINVDDDQQSIVFTAPMRYPEANRGVNEIQVLGSAITYMRRYLYMLALDICEPDSIDNQPGDSAETVKAKAPATPEQREEVQKELTDVDGNATELQIKGLKTALKRFREKDEAAGTTLATNLAAQTENFTKISKADCEKLVTMINAKLEG